MEEQGGSSTQIRNGQTLVERSSYLEVSNELVEGKEALAMRCFNPPYAERTELLTKLC